MPMARWWKVQRYVWADMGTGEISIRLNMAGNLYYRIITELMGENVANDHDFFTMLREFRLGKKSI